MVRSGDIAQRAMDSVLVARSRGGIVLPMMVTILQSTNQVETFSGTRAVISAPVGRRDVSGRMLARELASAKRLHCCPSPCPLAARRICINGKGDIKATDRRRIAIAS